MNRDKKKCIFPTRLEEKSVRVEKMEKIYIWVGGYIIFCKKLHELEKYAIII